MLAMPHRTLTGDRSNHSRHSLGLLYFFWSQTLSLLLHPLCGLRRDKSDLGVVGNKVDGTVNVMKKSVGPLDVERRTNLLGVETNHHRLNHLTSNGVGPVLVRQRAGCLVDVYSTRTFVNALFKNLVDVNCWFVVQPVPVAFVQSEAGLSGPLPKNGKKFLGSLRHLHLPRGMSLYPLVVHPGEVLARCNQHIPVVLDVDAFQPHLREVSDKTL